MSLAKDLGLDELSDDDRDALSVAAYHAKAAYGAHEHWSMGDVHRMMIALGRVIVRLEAGR